MSTNKRIVGRTEIHERLVSGQTLQMALQQIYTRINGNINTAEAQAVAQAEALINQAIANLIDGEDTLNTLRLLAEELQRLEDEKGGSITGIIADIASLRADFETHGHTFGEITGYIQSSQIPNNIINGNMLEDIGHGGLTAGPDTGGSGFDQNIIVPQFQVDAQGRIVAAADRTFHIPDVPDTVFPYTGAPRPLGPTAQPGSSPQFSRGDHVHPLPDLEDLNVAERDHTHTIGDIGAGTAMVGGVETAFDSLGEELAVRPNNSAVVNIARIEAGYTIQQQHGTVTEQHVELRLGDELVTRWEIVSPEQITDMISRII